MSVKLYGLKTCDTCRKALKELSNVEFLDVRSDGVPDATLARAVAQFGDGVTNKRSTTWRGLSDAERMRDPIELLSENPTLMKRPLIEMDGVLHMGWTEGTRKALGIS